ncbi:unnamed protein product, partial [Polarella glacialis]
VDPGRWVPLMVSNETSNATEEVSTMRTTITATTTTKKILGYNDPICSTKISNCSGCYALGCRYCEVSPEMVTWQRPDIFEYTCISRFCEDLVTIRPGTVSSRQIAVDACSGLPAPQYDKTTAAARTNAPPVMGQGTQSSQQLAQSSALDFLPAEWGSLHWVAVFLPLSLLLVSCSSFCALKRLRKFKRVHVEPQSASASKSQGFAKVAAAQWDFAKAGALDSGDLQATKAAMEASAKDDKTAGKLESGPGRRCLTFYSSNDLKAGFLNELEAMLQRHPWLTISMDSDWRRANDMTLTSLARLLMRHKGRCKFRTGAASGDAQPLRLPKPR